MIIRIVRHEFHELFRRLGSETCVDSEMSGPALMSSLFSGTCSKKKNPKKLWLKNVRLPTGSPDIWFHFLDIAGMKECPDNGIAVRGKYTIRDGG